MGQGSRAEREILIEENWNGGQPSWRMHIEVETWDHYLDCQGRKGYDSCFKLKRENGASERNGMINARGKTE